MSNDDADSPSSLIDIEVFAGAGGMTLGVQRAGFRFAHVYEIDKHTCATLKNNHVSNGGMLEGEVHHADVAEVSWSEFAGSVRLLAGGAPCQPFSLGGRHRGDEDDRNMFPDVLRVVRTLRPQAVLLENVQGLARPSFRPYFEYVLRQLRWPELEARAGDDWWDHNQRIQQHEANSAASTYQVSWSVLEAADYGVPQNRRRVFIVAIRSDLRCNFCFPVPTHSKTQLLREQGNGQYWSRHGLCETKSKTRLTPGSVEEDLDGTQPMAWKTVRDAIADLPLPAQSASETANNHWLIPGARLYRGHSGSALDWPSKTIKAGVHGVPGGENVLIEDDGGHRYFTLRETARLQGFPDSFVFCGARLHITRQIGNAVPVGLAESIGRQLHETVAAASFL